MGAMGSLIKFDKVDVTSDAEDLNIAITVLPANVNTVLAQLTRVAKLMGGGGGGGSASPPTPPTPDAPGSNVPQKQKQP
jgi:hypothetical protein